MVTNQLSQQDLQKNQSKPINLCFHFYLFPIGPIQNPSSFKKPSAAPPTISTGTVKARKKPESIFKARVEFCAELGEVNLKEKDKQNRDFKKNVCKTLRQPSLLALACEFYHIMHQLHTKSPDLDSIAYTSTRSR